MTWGGGGGGTQMTLTGCKTVFAKVWECLTFCCFCAIVGRFRESRTVHVSCKPSKYWLNILGKTIAATLINAAIRWVYEPLYFWAPKKKTLAQK